MGRHGLFGCAEVRYRYRHHVFQIGNSFSLFGGRNRLYANDRVDPYVAVYEPPSPSSIDDVTHLCWKGLMDSTFVRSVIDTAMYASPCPSFPPRWVVQCGIVDAERVLTVDRSCRRQHLAETITLLSRSRCILI